MDRRVAFLALIFTALAGGCVKQSATVEIYQACQPPEPTDTGACVFPAGECDMVPLGTYGIDVDVRDSFPLYVEVHNQLAGNGEDGVRGDTHNAFITDYTVSWEGPVAVRGVSGSIQQTVPSAGSTVVESELLGSEGFQDLLAAVHGTTDTLQFVVTLKLKGVYGDQSEFETAPRTFGVNVCGAGGTCVGTAGCDKGTPVFCPGPGMYPSTMKCVE